MITATVLAAAMAATAGLAGATTARGLGLVALAAGLATAVVGWCLAMILAPPTVPLAYAGWTLAMVSLLAALAVFDSATLTVPDGLTVPLVILGLVHAWLGAGAFLLFALLPIGLLALGYSGGKVLPDRVGQMIGGGDVIMFAGALAWLGPFMIGDLVLVTTGGVFLTALVLKVSDRMSAGVTRVPLAPGLAFAQTLLWLGGPIL